MAIRYDARGRLLCCRCNKPFNMLRSCGLCTGCYDAEPEPKDEWRERDIAALRTRLAEAEGLLRVMRESVSGLLMYEDDAIRDFAERRDPCPNVVTGPRKWLKRIREARAQIDAFLTGRAG
jgi:hypothetical protein